MFFSSSNGLRRDDTVDAAMTLYPCPAGSDPPGRRPKPLGSGKMSMGSIRSIAGLPPPFFCPWRPSRCPCLTPTRACAPCRRAIFFPSVQGVPKWRIVGASIESGPPALPLCCSILAEANGDGVHPRRRCRPSTLTRAGARSGGHRRGRARADGADAISDGAILIRRVPSCPALKRACGRRRSLPSVEGKAAMVTHVPDGIGPITTACLFGEWLRGRHSTAERRSRLRFLSSPCRRIRAIRRRVLCPSHVKATYDADGHEGCDDRAGVHLLVFEVDLGVDDPSGRGRHGRPGRTVPRRHGADDGVGWSAMRRPANSDGAARTGSRAP